MVDAGLEYGAGNDDEALKKASLSLLGPLGDGIKKYNQGSKISKGLGAAENLGDDAAKQLSKTPSSIPSLPLNPQKQASHVPGTPQYANRTRQGKLTSAFFGPESADAWAQKAWRDGKQTKNPATRLYDAGVSVGTGPNGGMQRQIRVSRDAQGQIHATPWGKEYK